MRARLTGPPCSATVLVKMTVAERAAVERLAKAECRTISNLVRTAVLDLLARQAKERAA
jgi:predicted transcriptional regulator